MNPQPPWASNHQDFYGFLLLGFFAAFVAGVAALVVRSPDARRRWLDFWFEPMPATSLTILRVIFYGGVLLFYLRFDFGLWGYVPGNFYRPIFWFDVLHLKPVGPQTLRRMAIVWQAATFLCLVGLGFRYAAWVVVVLGFYLWGIGNNFAKTGHGDAVLLLTSFFFALSRANDWLSLDALVARRRRRRPSGNAGAGPNEPPGDGPTTVARAGVEGALLGPPQMDRTAVSRADADSGEGAARANLSEIPTFAARVGDESATRAASPAAGPYDAAPGIVGGKSVTDVPAHATAPPAANAFGAPVSGEYKWPVRLVWVLVCMVFFAAGCAKLRRSGVDWITTDNMRTVLLQHHYQMVRPPTNLGLTIAAHPWMYHANAAAAVLLELAMPLALVSRRLRVLLVPAAGLMQLGIGLTMGVWFTQWFLCYMFFVPWGPIAEWVARMGKRVADSGDIGSSAAAAPGGQ